jgi:aconitate hydratase
MGVLPLQFQGTDSVASLKLTGHETITLNGVADCVTPRSFVTVRAIAPDGRMTEFATMARIDTPEELVSFRHGGILPYVLRQLVGR